MIDTHNEKFEALELFDRVVLFSNGRLTKSDIPDELYVYDLRDACDGIIYSVESKVVVNHFGSIICKHSLMDESSNSIFDGKEMRSVHEDDYSFLGYEMTIEEYMKSDDEIIEENN